MCRIGKYGRLVGVNVHLHLMVGPACLALQAQQLLPATLLDSRYYTNWLAKQDPSTRRWRYADKIANVCIRPMIIRSTGFLPLFLTISLASCSYTFALQLGLSSSNERSALLYWSEMPIRGLKGLQVDRLSNAHQLLCFNLVIEGPFLKLSSRVSNRFNIWSKRTRPIFTISFQSSSLPRPILQFVYASIRRFLLRLCRQSRFYFAATHLFFFSFFHSLQTATHVHLLHCNGHSEPSPKAYTRIYISKSLSIWWQTSSTTSSTTNIKLFVIIPRCPCKRCIVLIVGLAKTTSNTHTAYLEPSLPLWQTTTNMDSNYVSFNNNRLINYKH